MRTDLDLVHQLLARSDRLKGAVVADVTQLAGDMSTRRFSRVTFSQGPVSHAIMVTLSGAPGPVGGGPRGLTQDDTYIEVGSFLSKNGVCVPELYADGRDLGVLLVEDVGSTSLLSVAQGDVELQSGLKESLGADPLKTLFGKALSIQKKLRALPRDDQNVIFQRHTTTEQRAKQIREFLDYYALPRGLSDSGRKTIEGLMNTVCERVAQHPLEVSHFDYMASNIHVLPQGDLCLIDFQDMCLDSPARDVVSLLNDRDSDSALGRERQRELLALFMRDVNTHENFPLLYDEYLLLWDFRVSGRFALLAEQRGIARYKTWIPGTLRRLGRTLVRAKATVPGADEALAVLSRFSTYVREGSEDPWEFPLSK